MQSDRKIGVERGLLILVMWPVEPPPAVDVGLVLDLLTKAESVVLRIKQVL